MRKWLGIALAGLAALAWTGTARATNYALCTGLNKYSSSYMSGNDLTGCVPDAKNVYTNITLRGEWTSANAKLFTNSQGTFAAVSNQLMSFASTAVSGDVVLYYHSSHGYQDSGKKTGICMYDDDMPDTSFAKILANFKAGVKVVIVLDTCHSGGMFKSLRRDGATALASPFAFAQRVNEELAAIRADEAARGIRTAAKLAIADCGWVTAADYNQYSWDGEEGGAFTECFVGSVKSGACDKSPYGNGDSYATFKEMFDYAAAQDDTHGNGKPGTEDYTMPQCTNTTILAAVTFGWVGKEEPSGIRFAPIPEQTATVGAPLAYTLVASNVDGSTGAITFSVASSTAPAGSYSLNGADFTFTAPADGSYSFDFLATNKTAKTFGKASMNVSATLAAPVGLDSTGITASSFTANWDATAGAASYLLDVSSSDFGAKTAPKADDALLSENFEAFSGTSADRSSNLDEYLVGTGWTGSKVFENAGSAKLGSSKATGWIATPELGLSSGGSVSFLLSQYNTDANTVTVSILSGGDETEIGSVTPGSAETVEFAIPAATAATSVKIATSTKRAIIDDLVVTSGGGADVLANQPVEGTSYTVEGLETSTYYWRVRAVGNAKGPFSATEEVTLKSDPSAPPSIRKIDDIEIEVGETATAQVKVSAPDEAPVTSLSITDGDAAATLEDGVFSFAPAAPGTYDFTITAVNANGPAEVSFAVVATLAEPETPEQPTVVASDSFTAVWEAVPGAASYELVVIEGQGGSSGGGGSGGGSGETLTETFANATFSVAGSSYKEQTITGCDLGTWTATECRADKGTPVIRAAGTLTSPSIAGGVASVEFDYDWPFSESGSCDIDLYVNGTQVDSASVTGGTAGTASYASFSAVAGPASIEFLNKGASNKRIQVTQVRITTAAKSIAKAAGDVVFSNNVGNVTSYDVTGLRSSTEYTFAFRAVAENGETTDWSAPVTVKTDDGPSAPAWLAIPAQHAYVGSTFQLDLSGYLSGSPTPAVTADTGSVSGLHFVYEPDATGPVTVTLTAVNDSGTDTVSFDLAVDEPPVGGNHYAVIVGCNKYDTEYIDSGSFLNGCVPDANHVQALVTSRGQWDAANVAKLTDSSAKHSAVLSAIASAASKAVPGDTFLYFHSSHGGNYTYSFVTNTALYTDWPIMVYSVDPEGVDNCVCTYDADFTAAELASALADFDPAVNIVVMIDACHSAGMFQYDDGTPISQRAVRRNAAGKAMRPADPGLFAEAVGAQIGAIRRARGIRAAANVAFVTAANFDEYSFDAQGGDGGEFTSAFIEGVTNGLCDGADYGDQDGWATFYEGWNYAKDIATGLPEGTEVDYDGHAVDANGYALYDNSYYAQEYDEPEYYYDYYFTHPQIDNESLLRVVRVGYAGTPTLDAPVAAEAADVTASSFTASWSAVADATGYRVQVATDPSFSTGGAADTLTVDDLAATGTSYTDFSGISKDSGAVYAGRSAKSSSGAIQLNSSQSAGIWTTASGGNASRVAVEWNDGTTTSKPRSLQIYGSDTALDSYSAVKAATLLGSIDYGTASDLAIEGTYAYVGILANGGALYLDSVTVEWGTAGSGSTIVVDQAVGTVISLEVTGLEADTDYWYRVQALGDPVDSDFSNVISLTTAGGVPTAPAWSAIPAQSTYAGATFQLDLAPYLSGKPAPTVTADIGTVTGLNYVLVPESVGTVTVSLTAENEMGTAGTTFVLEVGEPPVGGNHYAVIVGCNKYDTEYIDSSSFLNGCVPDANHVQALITSRGEWEAGNVTKLTDSSAKHSAILSAISAAASKAVPGDTFLYFHSSHGGNYNYSFVTNTALYTDWPIMVYGVDPEGKDNCICSYDADFTAAELASALAAFDPAVNIVVMIDACHSAGMFMYNGTPVSQRVVRRNAAGKAMRSAGPDLFAEAVGAQIGAIRRARGIRAASNVAFVTAANFDEYSYDSESGDGGEFTTAFIEGVTNGLCDGADYGDQDGWATFYEGWNYAKDIATGLPVGTEVDDEGHKVDANGYALYDNSDYAEYYDEPEYYYDYYFTHAQIDNEALLRTVRVGYAGNPTLAAPVAAEATGVTDSSFTASWSAVDGATGYRLQVATDPSFSTGASSDKLTSADFEATSTTYTEFSGVAKASGAVYAGKTAKSSDGAIQLNATTTTGAGIWTTASGGNVSRVAVVWNSATATNKPRSIKVYGSDTAMTSYSAVKAGTSLGTIVYGTSTELAIDGTYAYVGIIADGGALYLDSVTIDWGTAGSESSIVFDQAVGNVTSHEVTGLEADTDYWYRVQALGDPVDSDFSNVIALTTAGGTPSAPVWSDIPTQTAVAGEDLVVDLKPYVTGSPKPTITADAGTVENGVLTVSFAEAGDYTVTLTAANSEGSANATLAVTVSAGPVDVPTLALSNPSSEGFDASWDACTGVTSYTLQIALDDQFTTGGGGEGEVVTETFASAAFSTTSSSYVDQTITGGDLGTWTATSCRGDGAAPVIRYAGTLTSPSLAGGVAAVEFDYEWPYKESGTCDIDLYVNDSKVGSATVTGGESGTASYTGFTAVGGPATIELRNTGTSNKRMMVTQVRITSASKSFAKDDGGSLVKELTVSDTFTTVTGLDPATTYYARVKGASDWSEVQSITTLSDEPAAPVWLEIPEQTATVDLEFGIDLSSYVTGNPFPVITVDGEETDGGAWVHTFDEAKTYNFALLASNSLGTAEATLTVVVTGGGEKPSIDAITIDAAAGTFNFAVPDGTTVETATDLMVGDWAPYEGEIEDGQVSIPMDDPSAYYRLVPSAD